MSFYDRFIERFDGMFGELDSRLRRHKTGEVFGTAGPLSPQLWERCFCCNCGQGGSYVTKDTPIVYLCNACFQQYGHLPLPVVPGTEEA